MEKKSNVTILFEKENSEECLFAKCKKIIKEHEADIKYFAMINKIFNENIKLKGNENYCICKVNKALENYEGSCYDEEGKLIGLLVNYEAAKKLFTELFIGVDFNYYLSIYDGEMQGTACDIIYMLCYTTLLNDNICFDKQKHVFYKRTL